MLVINKVDVKNISQLDPENRALIEEITNEAQVSFIEISCYTEMGVMDLRNTACDLLLSSRVEMKLKSGKISNVINKLHLAQPVARDDRVREASIPESALSKVTYDVNDPMRIRLSKDIEAEHGGAGVFNINLKGISVI